MNELKRLIQEFCDREYNTDRNPTTANDFTLYAVDCGGYDITHGVTFHLVGDRMFLDVGGQEFDLKLA